MRGDELLSRLLRSPDDSVIANDLLDEFHGGYPLDNLLPLLTSHGEAVAQCGMWIASELGANARPLFATIVEGLRHPSPGVRFWALDCLISCSTPEDTDAINCGLDLIDDPDPGVVWQALVSLASLPTAVVRAAADLAMRQAPRSTRAKGLDLVLAPDTPQDIERVILGLREEDQTLRRYAAVAAARLGDRVMRPLRLAMASEDSTIQRFAKDMAERKGFVPGISD